MTITVDTSKVNISSKAFKAAIKRTLNETVVSGKTAMSREVVAYYNTKVSDVKKSITVKKATVNNQEVHLRVRSKPIGLIHFGATASKAFDKGSKRYFKTKAKVLRKDKKKVVKGAFIGKAKTSGSWQVFRRTTDKRLPIIKMAVISHTTMVERKGIDVFEKTVRESFNKVFMRNFNFFSDKYKNK